MKSGTGDPVAGRHPARQGWWRRNWWGLAAVVPALAAVVLVSPEDPYRVWRDERTEEEAVLPGPDGWAGNGDFRVRLASFEPADDLVDGEGEPFRTPGLRVWQATVTFEILDPAADSYCGVSLADAAGRRFLPNPSGLSGAYDADGFLSLPDCSPPLDAADETGPFETTASFLLPESAEPAALRVELSDLNDYLQEPVYVRLEVG